jgi:hypothetical protein
MDNNVRWGKKGRRGKLLMDKMNEENKARFAQMWGKGE